MIIYKNIDFSSVFSPQFPYFLSPLFVFRLVFYYMDLSLYSY